MERGHFLGRAPIRFLSPRLARSKCGARGGPHGLQPASLLLAGAAQGRPSPVLQELAAHPQPADRQPRGHQRGEAPARRPPGDQRRLRGRVLRPVHLGNLPLGAGSPRRHRGEEDARLASREHVPSRIARHRESRGHGAPRRALHGTHRAVELRLAAPRATARHDVRQELAARVRDRAHRRDAALRRGLGGCPLVRQRLSHGA